MRYLPDTQILLWYLAKPHKLADTILSDILETSPAPVFSAVSIWEIAIKQSLGRVDFTAKAETVLKQLLSNGWHEIAFTGAHALKIATLPDIHKDPFDRALLAQAMVEDATLLTTDGILAKYPGPVRRI